MKIVGLAKAGEHDPERLCIAVLAELESPPVGGVERVDRGDTRAGPE
jgi:hypothetical protein